MDTEQLIDDLRERIRQMNQRLNEIRFVHPVDKQLAWEKAYLSGKAKAFEETIKHIQGFTVWNLEN